MSVEIIEPNNNLFRITSISTLSQESISNIWLDRENKYPIIPKSYYDYISVPFRSQSTATTSESYGYPIGYSIIPKFLKNEFLPLYKSSFSISLITTFFAILYTLLGLIPLLLGTISIFLLLFNTIFALINWKKKEKKNNKKSYKALALGLIAALFAGVGLGLAYYMQKKVSLSVQKIPEQGIVQVKASVGDSAKIDKVLLELNNKNFSMIRTDNIYSLNVSLGDDPLKLPFKVYVFDYNNQSRIASGQIDWNLNDAYIYFASKNGIDLTTAKSFADKYSDLFNSLFPSQKELLLPALKLYSYNQSIFDIFYHVQRDMSKLKVVVDYASNFEKPLQEKILKGFLFDNIITKDEIYQIKFLEQLSKEEQLKLIRNGKFVDVDIDNDRMSNYFEKVIAGLPWDIRNERYALLLYTGSATDILSTAGIKKFLIEDMKFMPQNIVYLQGSNATFENFKSAILQWENKINENDIVYISLFGHGGKGTFYFTGSKGVRYEEIDKYLDKLRPMKMLVAVSACYDESAIEPLKKGPSPRIVFTTGADIYFTQTSKNFPRGFYAPEPKGFDLDGNGYASLAEILKVVNDIVVKYGGDKPVISDQYNLASKFYLGDLRIDDD